MRAPVALLSLRLRSSSGGAIRAKDGTLTQALDRVLVLAALADAALDTSSGGRRLNDHLAMPWRVAAGALGAVATREAKPWAAPLLVGAATAWLGQKAERDCRRELTCAGIPPVFVGLAEEAVALSLPFVWRRRPALGLVCVPLAAGLIAAARGRKVTRYVTLGEVPRRVPPLTRTAGLGTRATVSCPSAPGAERGVEHDRLPSARRLGSTTGAQGVRPAPFATPCPPPSATPCPAPSATPCPAPSPTDAH